MRLPTRLLNKRLVMKETWILTLERQNLSFLPGQFIHLAPGRGQDRREYSIYSSDGEKNLEVLVKVQESGEVSPLLCGCAIGTELEMEGPGGEFTLSPEDRHKHVVMIATGSGISPFASLVRSYPGLNYTILHGLPSPDGKQEFGFFRKDSYIQCTSRHPGGDFSGRVTDYLSQKGVSPDSIYMLCGNSDMIYEVMSMLRTGGIHPGSIRAEIYF